MLTEQLILGLTAGPSVSIKPVAKAPAEAKEEVEEVDLEVAVADMAIIKVEEDMVMATTPVRHPMFPCRQLFLLTSLRLR